MKRGRAQRALGAAAGAAAPGLDLGTGVLALQLRTPMVAAMGAATLQALHPDADILLGIGISSPVVTTRWHGVPYGDRPLARVREYVTLVKACLSGEKVDFAGDFYEVKGFRLGLKLGDRKPKVVVGALNPAMLKLAGEVADGVLLNYLPASHVAWSVEQVRAGGSAEIYAYVHAGVGDRVHCVVGTIGDGGTTLDSLTAEHGISEGSVDFLFIDHDKAVYLADLLSIVARGWLHPGSIVLADNMGLPGSPKYLAHMREQQGRQWHTDEHRTHVEYQTMAPDLMLESEFLAQAATV